MPRRTDLIPTPRFFESRAFSSFPIVGGSSACLPAGAHPRLLPVELMALDRQRADALAHLVSDPLIAGVVNASIDTREAGLLAQILPVGCLLREHGADQYRSRAGTREDSIAQLASFPKGACEAARARVTRAWGRLATSEASSPHDCGLSPFRTSASGAPEASVIGVFAA